MSGREWLKRGLSGVLILLFIFLVAIGVVALTEDNNKKAGILTLQVSNSLPSLLARFNCAI